VVLTNNNYTRSELNTDLFISKSNANGDSQLTSVVSFSKVNLDHTTVLSQCSSLGHPHCELSYEEEVRYPPWPRECYGWKCCHILNLKETNVNCMIQKEHTSFLLLPISFEVLSYGTLHWFTDCLLWSDLISLYKLDVLFKYRIYKIIICTLL